MKLIYFKYNNPKIDHPLNGFEKDFRNAALIVEELSPICLVGINGSGKSKLLECIAEVFEYLNSLYTDFITEIKPNEIQFQIDYLFKIKRGYKYVRFIKNELSKKTICFIGSDEDYLVELFDIDEVRGFLPEIVIGYSSGENESLSSYFHPYNDSYSDYYQTRAIYPTKRIEKLPDLPHFLWVDYKMNNLVFISNSILGLFEEKTWSQITKEINIESLKSFRITIKLKPKTGPVKGIFPAPEQKEIIEKLKNCSTSSSYSDKENTTIFDFYLSDATKLAFKENFKTKLNLYISMFQLYLLNHVLIRSELQEINRIQKETGEKLGRPQINETQKAFNISNIKVKLNNTKSVVSYRDLSDGEHQYLHVFGTLNMVNKDNVLFLMDEPETHFNPQWRSAFISNMKSTIGKSKQEYLITTHSPFLLSDSKSENVFIFNRQKDKIKIKQPEIQTYGTAIDKLLEIAFGVAPPIAKLSSDAINRLINNKNKSIEELEKDALGFGDSIKKMMLYHHIEELKAQHKNKK